jgi:hypothetical protein
MKFTALATMAAIALLPSLTVSTPSFAKMVNNSTASSLLTQCMLADDANTDVPTMPSGWGGCCSASLGYCVECPPKSTDKCHKYPTRGGTSRNQSTAPEVGAVAPKAPVRDHRKAPKSGGVSAQ